MDTSSKKLQVLYGVCAAAGVVVTMYCNMQFMSEHGGFPIITFIADNYANYASASITNDILVVTVVFLIWSFIEARRLSMSNWWVYAVLTFSVALGFSLPLFLLIRERRIAAQAESNMIKSTQQ